MTSSGWFAPEAGEVAPTSLDALRARRFVITGPTGWIGAAALAWLRRALGEEGFRRQVKAFGSSAREITVEGEPFTVRALGDLRPADVEGAIVYHLAYLTRDKIGGISDADYVARNLAIDDAVFYAIEAGRPAGLFVASSGAAREVERGGSKDFYGLLKLAQEERAQKFGQRTRTPVFVGRIFNIAGPYVNKHNLYALASFVSQALDTGEIRIEASIPVYRSYVHVLDMIAVIAATLVGGDAPSEAVDISGQEVLEMQDIAEGAARAVGLNFDVVRRAELRYDAKSLYLGDSWPFRTLALRSGLRPRSFAQQAVDTAVYLRALREDALA